MITSACLLCGAVYCWLWLILSKIVLDLLQLNSIYGESGFCCLCSEKKMEGVRVHSNTHEIAAGSIFCHNLVWWFECMCSKAITNQRIRLTWYAGRNSREREGGRQSEGSAVLLCGICKYWGFLKNVIYLSGTWWTVMLLFPFFALCLYPLIFSTYNKCASEHCCFHVKINSHKEDKDAPLHPQHSLR